MLFAAALTSTVVVICTTPCSVFSTVTTSPNDENMPVDTSSVYCNNNFDCPGPYGSRRCENHVCMCDENFYRVYNHSTGETYCRLCSLFQESCVISKCCRNPQATYCAEDVGVCVCKPGMDEECLSMIYRGRYTPTLGIQLANTLSVSFAFVFLAITFVAVIRKTLFGCSYFRCDSISRVSSDSSLNEFIKQKMQNRPPCYDDIEKDRKVPIDQVHQPPPVYGSVNFGRPNTSFQGIVNPSLSISDEVEMNNTAPPNYSTFTTVTDVTAAGTTAGRINNEIILTQPIYMNRSSPRYTY